MKTGKYYQYRQYTLAKLVYDKGFQTTYKQYELKLLAVYLRDYVFLKPKARKERLVEFCKKHIADYHPRANFRMINTALDYASNKHNVLVEIPEIIVYKSEVAFINLLEISNNAKRLLFAMIVQKKLDKGNYEARHPGKTYNLSFMSNDAPRNRRLGKIAGVAPRVDVAKELLFELFTKHIVETLPNGTVVLTFSDHIVHAGDEAVRVVDYEHIGLYWDYLLGNKKVGICVSCGSPYRSTSNRQKHCVDCQGYAKIETPREKIIVCAECGVKFAVRMKAVKTYRCEDCQRLAEVTAKRDRRQEAANLF